MLILLACMIFPMIYAEYEEWSCIQAGRARADEDWLKNEAIWYVTTAEITAMTNSQVDRYMELEWKTDPVSGLLTEMMRSGWWAMTYQSAYRKRIEELLAENDQSPPDFGK